MSYIRCHSNPESLYIFQNTKGQAEITHLVKVPHASKDRREVLVPFKVFEQVCRLWLRNGEHVHYRDCEAKELHVFIDSGRCVPLRFNPLRSRRETRYVVRFRYKRQWFDMWRVTWSYIVDNVTQR